MSTECTVPYCICISKLYTHCYERCLGIGHQGAVFVGEYLALEVLEFWFITGDEIGED